MYKGCFGLVGPHQHSVYTRYAQGALVLEDNLIHYVGMDIWFQNKILPPHAARVSSVPRIYSSYCPFCIRTNLLHTCQSLSKTKKDYAMLPKIQVKVGTQRVARAKSKHAQKEPRPPRPSRPCHKKKERIRDTTITP